MPGIGLVSALVLTLFGAEPLWPDLSKLPPVTGGGEKDVAVVVAVENYFALPAVRGAGDLGVAWFNYLRNVRKVPLVVLVRDKNATANGIRDAVEKVRGKAKAGGRAWFVFIGHGAPSEDGRDGVLVGVSAQATQRDFFPNAVARGEILQLLAAAGGSEPPVVVIDACFSGTDMMGKTLITDAQFAVNVQVLDTKGATVLTAGRASDIAGSLPGGSGPAFSYLMLGALRGWGDQDGDGVVTSEEAVQYAQDALLQLDPPRQQQPQHSGIAQALVGRKGSKLERGPDIGDIVLKLSGGVKSSTAATAGNEDMMEKLAALEKARKLREEAEAAEAAAKAAAAKSHQAEVEQLWAQVKAVAEGGGPEGKEAVELFLKRYANHQLGNPKEAEAKRMLERFGQVVGAASKGYVLVKPGCFQMGSPSSEADRDSDETQHEVCITKGFFLKETEVTQREWRDVIGNNPSHFSSCGDTCPVESVSWFEVVAYANALSKKEGLEECYTLSGCSGTLGGGCGGEMGCVGDYKCSNVSFKGLRCTGYRLPTEAEWEYAARAGSRDARHGNLDDVAWYRSNSGSKSHAVRQKKPNAWGFYDILGNVWEWTWDWYGAYDTTRNDPLGASTGSARVDRGGGWSSYAGGVRAASRLRDEPGGRYRGLGFRLGRSQ